MTSIPQSYIDLFLKTLQHRLEPYTTIKATKNEITQKQRVVDWVYGDMDEGRRLGGFSGESEHCLSAQREFANGLKNHPT